MKRQFFFLFAVLSLAGPVTRAQGPIITEFMAANSRTLADEDGEYADWIELHNPTAAPVSVNGWYLTDNESKKTKWRIPAITIPAKGYRIIFASGKDRASTSGNLHTSFKLDAGGEYLALVKPDGLTVATQYAPIYPPQESDVSYGMPFYGWASTLVSAGAPARALVPSDGSLGTSWTATEFDDGGWPSGTTGVGYERGSGYESYIGLNVVAMYETNQSCYIRVPFSVSDTTIAQQLSLRLMYDDGFVAYLNGTRVAAANEPASPVWDSGASDIHDDNAALVFQDFDISTFSGALRNGYNVLAIHGLNAGAGSSDFLMVPELVASSGAGIQTGTYRYFTIPTPGESNAAASATQGPDVQQVSHSPLEPTAGQSIVVTAKVAPLLAPVATVKMRYRAQYSTEQEMTMLDDGAHGDGGAGDGVFGATIPGSASVAGRMVRYFVMATDTADRSTRRPLFVNQAASPQYFGAVVKDPSIVTPLRVLHWFCQNPAAADTESGTRASVYFEGQFLDNVFVRLRGNTSAYWPKKHHKFELNSGYYLRYSPDEEPVDEFNLQSTYSDKAYIRQTLSWDAYADAGVPGCFTFPVRSQQNGAFHSMAIFMEQPDMTMLARNGLDPDGAQYKMYNQCDDAYNGVEKKGREWEDNSDLQALVTGVRTSGTTLTNYLFDNVNVPEVINYLAVTSIMHDNDHVAKNYYLYRDTEGTGEWQMLPWDKDLTFGRNYVPWDGGVLSDEIWADDDPYSHPLFGNQSYQKVDSLWNRFIDAMYRNPATKAMYLRRLRTVMDEQLQPLGTPVADLRLEKRIDSLVALIRSDVVLDRAKWGNPYGLNQDLTTAISVLKNSYLGLRRKHLYQTHGGTTGMIPPAQAGAPTLNFGTIERSPAGGDVNQQYIEIINPNTVTVDISYWRLEGDVSHTFAPGTVLVGSGRVYVSPNVRAFRTRTTAPKGGTGLFVQGDYKGDLSSPPESLRLVASNGAIVASTGYTLPDLQYALATAAGLGAPAGSQATWLNVVTDGGSATVVDMADAAAIARRLFLQ